MSVEKLALRAHIFVGLEFESPLLETYFLVELVVVPGLSLSQPYLFFYKQHGQITPLHILLQLPDIVLLMWPYITTTSLYIYLFFNYSSCRISCI
jgi:hypothetical protein